jgi:hypothetical protein
VARSYRSVRGDRSAVEDPTEAPPEPTGYLDGGILVPLQLGVFLIVGAALLWVGSHGAIGGYLTLYWAGILCIVLGVALLAALAVVPLGALSLGGVLWLVLERVALVVGPPIGWVAPALAVVGALLLPGPVRRVRQVVAERRAWAQLKGGSVPP